VTRTEKSKSADQSGLAHQHDSSGLKAGTMQLLIQRYSILAGFIWIVSWINAADNPHVQHIDWIYQDCNPQTIIWTYNRMVVHSAYIQVIRSDFPNSACIKKSLIFKWLAIKVTNLNW
jgi:hypothetical protein